jgi:hypothetical protein
MAAEIALGFLSAPTPLISSVWRRSAALRDFASRTGHLDEIDPLLYPTKVDIHRQLVDVR